MADQDHHSGTGKTIPFSCTDNAAAKNEMLLTSLIPTDSRENMGRVWARGRVNGNICAEDPNGVGEFVGTAFTARDFMSVVDSLGEDGMLRYWGKLILSVFWLRFYDR